MTRAFLEACAALAQAWDTVRQDLADMLQQWRIYAPLPYLAPVPGFRPNAPRRRMRTPGGRIVRRVTP